MAILDSACSKTVAGISWVEDYIACLPKVEKLAVEQLESNCQIVFGDGKREKSMFRTLLPAILGNMGCKIECEVVSSPIPLLLSMRVMEHAKFTVDFANLKCTVGDSLTPVPLKKSTSGHYMINIMPPESMQETVMLTLDKPALEKLHKQFGHCSGDRLMNLIKSCNTDCKIQTDLVKSICEECQVCKKFGRPRNRPIVSMPLASAFNDIVAMDLHELTELGRSVYYLHLIDVFTRFSAATIIMEKKTDVVIDAINNVWGVQFGYPHKFMSDNGGEFSSAKMRSFGECYDVEIMTTPAYSPWANGIVERHNAILSETFLKLRLDKMFRDDETCLKYSVFAKNCLLSANGFSPYQLVYGRNPNLPSCVTNRPPALENITTSEHVQRHISLLQKSREAYIAAESSERVKRALRANIRSDQGPFHHNEAVYYKRNENQWRGPGRVIGQTGREVMIKHGGQVISVHTTRLKRVNNSCIPEDNDQENGAEKDPHYGEENEPIPSKSEDGEEYDDTQVAIEEEYDDTQVAIEDDGNNDTDQQSDLEKHGNLNKTNSFMNNHQLKSESIGSKLVEKMPLSESKPTAHPSIKDRIKITLRRAPNEEREAIVLSRGGKVGKSGNGKHKNWFNVEYVSPECHTGMRECLEFGKDTVDWSKIEEPVLLNNVEPDPVEIAKEKELLSWGECGVYEEVYSETDDYIDLKWVITTKSTGIVKARLVAKGFQDPDNAILVKDAPTCAKENFRVILTLISSRKHWKVGIIDVKTAFLQGNRLKREVYVRPPEEFRQEHILWKLLKPVYGLSDAPRLWYERVKEVLTSLKCLMSTYDACVFIFWNEGTISGIVTIHVDDFFYAGDNTFYDTVISGIRDAFTVGKEQSLPTKYLGLDVGKVDDVISISLEHYSDELSEIQSVMHIRKTDPVSDEERKIMRSKLGKLLWVSTQVRVDLAFITSKLSSSLSNPVYEDLAQMNKVIRDIKAGFGLNLKFNDLGEPCNWNLFAFSDASLNNIEGGYTQAGYLIFLVNKTDGRCTLLQWRSYRLRRVARSTLAAELLAASECADVSLMLRSLLREITKEGIKTFIFTDNNSLVDAVYSTKLVSDKRLRVDVAYLREIVSTRDLVFIWINTSRQLADGLTKQTKNGELKDVMAKMSLKKYLSDVENVVKFKDSNL